MSTLSGHESSWDAVGHNEGVSWLTAVLVIAGWCSFLWWLK